MQTEPQDFGWYAIRVKSNREKLVAASLTNRGYESFLPLYRAERQWSDRVKSIDFPLFSGYVFCRLDCRLRLPALTVPGAVGFVSSAGQPVRVNDQEIAALQAIAGSGIPTAPWPYLRAGQRVRIERGPLKDIEGILTEVKNQFRLVVSVDLLQRSVAVEVDRSSIRPLSQGAFPQREAFPNHLGAGV